MTRRSMSLVYTPGDVILGRYRIESALASGAMGSVYVARQLSVDRLVAIKALHPKRMWDAGAIERLRREAEALARLNHPHIVHLFEAELDPRTNAPVLVSELVPGRSLLAVLREEGALPVRRAVAMLAQIAEALSYAHRAGIVHRDLKPANVMVVGEGEIKVLDFGLAKAVDEGESGVRLTAPGAFVGTIGFASPEQMLGDVVDERTDLYSLGCLLFACLAARAPLIAEDTRAAAKKQLTEAPPPLPDEDIEGSPIPSSLSALYRALLERNPKNRPASAAAVTSALAAVLSDRTELITEVAPRLFSPLPPPPTPILSGTRVAVAAALIGAALTVSVIASVLARAPQEIKTTPIIEPAAVALPAARSATVASPSPSLRPDDRPDIQERPRAPVDRRLKRDAGESAYPVW